MHTGTLMPSLRLHQLHNIRQAPTMEHYELMGSHTQYTLYLESSCMRDIAQYLNLSLIWPSHCFDVMHVGGGDYGGYMPMKANATILAYME